MRANIFVIGSAQYNNKRPVEDNLNRKGHYSQIITPGKMDKQLKLDIINISQFSRGVFILVSLITFISVITSCTKYDEHTGPTNEFINIPDNQFESILIEQNIDSDGVINQKISKTDALGVTHLDLHISNSNMYIEDLTGIEGFTNLTFLSASGHLIEAVDLSHNILLDTVLLQANELKSVHGLSKLNNLTKLDLSWNMLDSLSFQSESIELLLANNNLLEVFEVESADNLKGIVLTGNKLSSINLSSYSLLETLLLSDNNIQTIDLSQNDNLSHLYISANSLSELSVSSNQNLVDLRVDRNPSLTCIHINYDQEIPNVSLSEYQELNTNCN